MPGNRERIVYVGQREAVIKYWRLHKFVFLQGKPTKVPDAFAAELLKSQSFVHADESLAPVDERFPDGGEINIRRWGALGDLLMLRAVVSAMMRARDKLVFSLRCHSKYVDVFKFDPIWVSVRGIETGRPEDVDGMVNFDQVAEADHRGDVVSRVGLFMKAMTSEDLEIIPTDWEVPIPAAVSAWVHRYAVARGIDDGQRKVVAVQVRGSGKMKSLPGEQIRAIINGLVKSGRSVILIEQDDAVASKFVGEHVHSLTDRDALHVIAMLRQCDLAITMDSGALWLAHCAACPVLCIMGPTRASERLTFHPLYPAMARAVALNEIISCPACFEAAKTCGKKYTCMQEQPDWPVAIRQILGAADDMLSSRIKLPQAEPGSSTKPDAAAATQAQPPARSVGRRGKRASV